MNDSLKRKFEDLNITSCELKFKGCLNGLYLTPAHRHKRVDYKKRPEMLWNINQVIVACQNCHKTIESNKELTELLFTKLRGEDALS